MSYLGHIVSEKGVECDPSNIKVVQEWPEPTNVHEVRSFLGTANYYRRFVKGFAKLAGPLTRLTRKHTPFNWTDSCRAAFRKLRECLTSPPILAYPLQEETYILDTDASNFAIGAVLSQRQNGVEKVIAYSSNGLSNTRQRYCVTHKELYAVVTAVKKFKRYLLGRRFIVRTDHAALKWLMQFKDPEGMVARWISFLSTFEFDIEHRPEISMEMQMGCRANRPARANAPIVKIVARAKILILSYLPLLTSVLLRWKRK